MGILLFILFACFKMQKENIKYYREKQKLKVLDLFFNHR